MVSSFVIAVSSLLSKNQRQSCFFTVSIVMLPLAKKAKIDENTNDFSLCILCQSNRNTEQLVEKPKSYERVLEFVEKRASYNDTIYPNIWNRLRNATACRYNE